MKSKFRKIVVLVVSFAVAFSMLGISPVLFGAEKITITSWDNWRKNRAENWCTALELVQEEFARTHPNIKVNHLIQPAAGAREGFVTAMAGGTGPDAFDNACFPFIPVLIEKGFIYPLDEYIKDWEHKDDVVESLWGPATEKGVVYGIPSYIYVMLFGYRKSLFKEAGLPMRAPENWDELVQFAQKLTVPEKGQYGLGLLGTWFLSWYWENFVWAAGGDVTRRLPDGNIELSFTDPQGVCAAQFYQDLVHKYKCVQKNVLCDMGDITADFITGRCAMWIIQAATLIKMVEQGIPEDEIGVGVLPAGPTGVRASQMGGSYWTINPTIDKAHRDAAWEYIKFMASPDAFVKRWKKMSELGMNQPVPSIYKSIDPGDHMDLPEEWAAATKGNLKYGRAEYLLKDKIEPYLGPYIQKLLLDAEVDAWTELVACAEKIAAELPGTVLAASAKK